MPEQPRPKIKPARISLGSSSLPGPAYAELQCRSCFTFLRGASHPEELVGQAANLGYSALAITDDASLGGVVRAHLAAKKHGLELIIGSRIELQDGPSILLYALNRRGYGALSRLITVGRRRAPKGSYELFLRDVFERPDDLFAIALACEESSALRSLRDAFGDRIRLALTLLRGPDDAGLLARQRHVSARTNLPLVVTGDVHTHVPERQRLQDVMACIRDGLTLNEACRQGLLFPNAEHTLRPRADLAQIYAGAEDALERTLEVSQLASFSLDELRYEYPDELVPEGHSASSFLAELAWAGAEWRYPSGVPPKVKALIEHELELIAELSYEPFFLTVWDVVRYAGEKRILVQGRGSAANSAVCYCLGITSVDPDSFDVLFARFVSRARAEPPDIDLDIEHERREEILQYLYTKYSRERAALASEIITYRERSASREVAKVFDVGEQVPEGHALGMQLVREIQGFPRHRSQHVGGFVMTRGPLYELVPVENAAMPDRTVVEWDKDDLDALGILKVDCLGLGMLTCIRKCFELIDTSGGPSLDLGAIPMGDDRVYAMLSRADAIGVFQVESRAQLNMLPRLKPTCFYDLVIEVSLVRPGPIQGGMVHPYLRRRQGLEEVKPIHPVADRVLRKTLGVPIFQEQAMRLAIELVGFSPDEADALRKSMGAWRKEGTIARFERRFVDAAVAQGVSRDWAQRLFEQIKGFGEYGFPESHAASFARLAYISAWLKRYYPVAYTAALLNSQPMGFYAPAQLVRDAKDHGVVVLPVDVEASGWDHRLETKTPEGANVRSSQTGPVGPTPRDLAPELWGKDGPALRLGLRLVKGLGEDAGRAVEAARRGGPFRSVAALGRRARLQQTRLERLAQAGALAALAPESLPRRNAVFDALAAGYEAFPLFAKHDPPKDDAELPQLGDCGETIMDYQTTGLSLRRHPMSFARSALDELGVQPISALREIRDGQTTRVAGLVICRQRPSTAKGIVFVTLEDETGTANLVVRPHVTERHSRLVYRAPILLVNGKVEKEGLVIHLLVRSLRDVSTLLPKVNVASRSWR
jgi:error-prone DNA polymerase